MSLVIDANRNLNPDGYPFPFGDICDLYVYPGLFMLKRHRFVG